MGGKCISWSGALGDFGFAWVFCFHFSRGPIMFIFSIAETIANMFVAFIDQII